jgi:hypothetical protein
MGLKLSDRPFQGELLCSTIYRGQCPRLR